MRSDAETADDYMAALPEDRRAHLQAVREVILANLPDGFVEAMDYGMPCYSVPLETYPDTYNGHALTVASLANQKRHMAIYLMGIYADDAEAAWFKQRWESTGKKLDMGKSCVRFRDVDDVPLDVIGEAIARTSAEDLITAHERVHG